MDSIGLAIEDQAIARAALAAWRSGLLEITVSPARRGMTTGRSYTIANLSCGDGEQKVFDHHDSVWCRSAPPRPIKRSQ